MLAIVWVVKYFRPYLFGNKFTLVTDHKPVIWLMNFKEPNSKIVRWRLQLLEYDFEIIYKKGSQNVIADALTRADASFNHNESLPETNFKCPKSENPHNDFNIQLIFKLDAQTSFTTVSPFKHKIRKEYRKPSFDFNETANILKQTLKPHRTSAVFADDHIFNIIERAFAIYFSHSSKFKMIRCLSFLLEISNNTDQNKMILDYHLNNNHRGINETLLHIKREYFFSHMKNKIAQLIRKCETCLKLKYDRQPQKIAFTSIMPEIPSNPLDIVHIDI